MRRGISLLMVPEIAPASTYDGYRSRQVWTSEDDCLVMDDDIDIEELSMILGRSRGAIYQRRHRLRFGDSSTSNHECLWCLHRMD